MVNFLETRHEVLNCFLRGDSALQYLMWRHCNARGEASKIAQLVKFKPFLDPDDRQRLHDLASSMVMVAKRQKKSSSSSSSSAVVGPGASGKKTLKDMGMEIADNMFAALE